MMPGYSLFDNACFAFAKVRAKLRYRYIKDEITIEEWAAKVRKLDAAFDKRFLKLVNRPLKW